MAKPIEAFAEPGAPGHWLSRIAGFLHAQTKRRAQDRDLMFTLTVDDVFRMGQASNWRCAVTGMKFSQERGDEHSRRAFAPSIDRINCGLGYTPENCRLVCVITNIALSDWGEGVLKSGRSDRIRTYDPLVPNQRDSERSASLLGGGAGFRGDSLGDIGGVAQPAKLPASTISINTDASLTGGGKPASFVRAVLAAPLQRSRLVVGLRSGSSHIGMLKVSSIASSLHVADRSEHQQASKHPQAPVQEVDHASISLAASYRASRSS
jgi:hypothetical protein